MQIYTPENIFSTLLLKKININNEFNINFLPSSLISNKINEKKESLFLLPVLELIKHEDIFVSSKIGISFQGNLSNTYFYFNNKNELKSILLKGDISTTEVLLAKIVLKELYGVEINVELKSENKTGSNILLCGNENFKESNFISALSLTETIDELISLPFSNYVFASYDKNKIEKINSLSVELNNKIFEESSSFFREQGINNDIVESLEDEITTVTFEFFENEREAVNQITRLPYYYGFFEEIIEIKFV